MVWKVTGFPVPKYTLYKNDELLKISERMKIQGTLNNKTNERCLVVTISKALKEDEGTYKVIASNSAGEASTQGRIVTSGGRYNNCILYNVLVDSSKFDFSSPVH